MSNKLTTAYQLYTAMLAAKSADADMAQTMTEALMEALQCMPSISYDDATNSVVITTNTGTEG